VFQTIRRPPAYYRQLVDAESNYVRLALESSSSFESKVSKLVIVGNSPMEIDDENKDRTTGSKAKEVKAGSGSAPLAHTLVKRTGHSPWSPQTLLKLEISEAAPSKGITLFGSISPLTSSAEMTQIALLPGGALCSHFDVLLLYCP
jgi:hypothetical protein